MADECQYLEYRPLADEGSGDSSSDDAEPRAYCTAAQLFVQAMRADICNRRYGLDPETDCEIYRDHEGLPEASAGEGAKIDDARDAQTDGARDTQTDDANGAQADDAGGDRTDGGRE